MYTFSKTEQENFQLILNFLYKSRKKLKLSQTELNFEKLLNVKQVSLAKIHSKFKTQRNLLEYVNLSPEKVCRMLKLFISKS